MKPTLKQRFKKALFEFFKQEILDYLEVNKFPYRISPEKFVHNTTEQNIEFKEVKTEIVLKDNDDYRLNNIPVSRLYEQSLEDTKKLLFEEMLKYVEIDTASVMDSYIYPIRKLRMRIFVGKIKH